MTDDPFDFDWGSLFNQLNGGGGQTFGLPGNTGNPYVTASPLTEFHWLSLKRNSNEIGKLFFPSAKKQTSNPAPNGKITIEKEPGCNCDLTSSNFNVYRDYNGNNKMDDGEFLFDVRVFVSKDGLKVEQAYNECEPKPSEVLFFLEDNTGDWSTQKAFAKFGTLVDRNVLLTLDEGGLLNSKLSSVPGFSRDMLKELIDKGVVTIDMFSVRSMITGLIYCLSIPNIAGKVIGEVLDFAGQVILDYLAIPERFWDTDSEEYFLKKENITKSLTISQETIQIIEKGIREYDTSGFVDTVMLGFADDAKAKIAEVVTSLINKYNLYIIDLIDKVYAKFEGLVIQADSIFLISERIAFYCGIWNGLVDFVGGLLKFVGMLVKIPYEVTSDSDKILEMFDNLTEAIHNIDFGEIWDAIVQAYENIKLYFKEKNSEDINTDKVAYAAGFGLAFIASFFIPFTQIAKLGKFAQVGKAFIPAKYLDEISNTISKAGKVVGEATKSAYDEGIKLLNEILSLLRKGKQALTEFFEKIWKSIADWFLKNKKLFKGSWLVKGGKYTESAFFYNNVRMEAFITELSLFGQEKFYTCASASLRMVLADRKILIAEEELAILFKTTEDGANMMKTGEVLEALGISNKLKYSMHSKLEIQNLVKLLKKGDTAIVSIQIKGHTPHAMLIEKIENTIVYLRDPMPGPWGSSYSIALDDFAEFYRDRCIIFKKQTK